MCKIKKCPIENADKFYIANSLWGTDEYRPEVYVKLAYNDKEFMVEFTVKEKNPTKVYKKHYDKVHEDSCAEIFLNFSPKTEKKYINFEVNANGAMNPAFRPDRYSGEPLKIDEIESFDIKTQIYDDYWTASYNIGFDFIKKYYPDFDIKNCDYLLGNAYKCGDKTPVEHYISLFKVGCEEPDFHRPEYFDKFIIER